MSAQDSPAVPGDQQLLPVELTAPPPGERPPLGHWWGYPHLEFRWQLELARLMADPIYRGNGLAPGDGRAVVLLPGFLAGDWSMRVMGRWLQRLGYSPRTCGFLLNVGCSDDALNLVSATVEREFERTGRRVAVVGHSRGGHYAKAVAVQHPELVSHAISMGAALARPLDISVPTRAAVSLVRVHKSRTTDRVARRGCMSEACTCPFSQALHQSIPPTVRLVSIHSKGDGVVRWRSCLVPDAQNVEISGSHVGMAFNRRAYRVIAQTLAAPELTAADRGQQEPA